MSELDGEPWRSLAFRDPLRRHPEDARDYERLERELAVRRRADREAYTAAKSGFIEAVMAKAPSPSTR